MPEPMSMPEPEPIEPGPSRRMMVRQADFVAHGFTDGCPGCISIRAGRRSARCHSERCRARIEAELIKTSEGLRKERETARRGAEFERAVHEEERNLPASSADTAGLKQQQQQPAAQSESIPVQVGDPEFEDIMEDLFEDNEDVAENTPVPESGISTPRGGS